MPRMAKLFWIKVTFLKGYSVAYDFIYLGGCVFHIYYQDIARDYSSQRSLENFGKKSKPSVESSI